MIHLNVYQVYIMLLVVFFISCKKENNNSKWHEISNSFKGDLIDAQYISKDEAYIIGINTEPLNRYNVLLKSQDGGLSWSVKKFSEPEPGGIKSLFVSNQHLIFGSFYSVYKTTDEGENWKNIDTTQPINNVTRGLYFENEENGIILKPDGIYRVSNGAFNIVYNETSGTSLKKLKHTSTNTFFATAGIAGNKGILLKSINNGSSWVNMQFNYEFIEDLFFINEKVGFALSGYDMLKTNDGGISWTKQNSSPLLSNSGVIYFNSEAEGFFATSYGSILHTHNGGKNWDTEMTLNNVQFTAISSFAGGNILVIGSNGTVLLNY